MELGEAVAEARQGDPAAFAVLYSSLAPAQLRHARGLVGQDGEDVVSEAWLQIARDIRRFQGGEPEFRAWSARIVRNRAVDQLRSAARRDALSMPVANLPEPPACDDTETIVLERLSTTGAMDLVGSLPPDQADAVLLRAIVGMDAADAGSVVGKSAGAVRVAAHRGLRNLGRKLPAPGRGSRGRSTIGSGRDSPVDHGSRGSINGRAQGGVQVTSVAGCAARSTPRPQQGQRRSPSRTGRRHNRC